MLDRYKSYINILFGKQDIDQMSIIFSGETDNNKYLKYMSEYPKFWHVSISKQLLELDSYGVYGKKISHHIGSLLYSLYLFKDKDLTILKASVILPMSSGINENFYRNCSRFFLYNLKKTQYLKFEFTKEKRRLTPASWPSMDRFEIRNIKIFIDQDKTCDDLANLLMNVDQWNDYVQTLSVDVWDSIKSIKENINFNFSEVV